MVKVSSPKDLLQILLSVLFISVMIIACLWIVRPFVLGFAWAGTVVLSTWPVMLKLQRLLWGKRSLAVLVMTFLLLMLFVIPVALLVNSLVDSGGSAIMAKIRPYIGTTTTWFLGQAVHIGRFLMHCGLMLLFSVLLYAKGETLGKGIRHFAFRLAGNRGDAAVLLAAQAIRAVALGVVVTALVQSVLGGLGLAVAGIPNATLLTVLMMLCCLVQIGPLLVLIPSIIWLYWSGDTTWGTVLLVWSCIVGTIDNFIRPVLIRMGADLPMILILSGVIGGLIAFGMIGLFIGPVVLAVSYRLISVWMHETPPPQYDADEVVELLEEHEEEQAAK